MELFFDIPHDDSHACQISTIRADFPANVADNAHSSIDFVAIVYENAVDFVENLKNICIYQKYVVILRLNL